MTRQQRIRYAGSALMYGAGVGAAGYAAYAGAAWLRYGHVHAAAGDDRDPLLDRFMPAYDVVERHHVRVAAPADVAFAAACDLDLRQSATVRAIFRTRELLLGSEPDEATRPRELIGWTKSIGWGVLAEIPGREIVLGGAARPWDANVVFRAIPPDDFSGFNEPNFVKIVWTLRADPAGADASIVRHETRAVATDPAARRRFRRYWAAFSAGITTIRRIALRSIKTEAERRARAGERRRDRFESASRGDLDPQC